MSLSTEELWADCGKASKVSSKDTTPDGLRGRFRIPSSVRETYNIESGSRIEVRVQHNGKTVTDVREVHSDGLHFVLPTKKRGKLELSTGDRPKFWVRPASTNSEDSNETESGTQASLSDVVESNEDTEYVLLFNSEGNTLHAMRSGDKTLCGKGVDSAEGHADSPDNVSGASECQRCAQYATGNRSLSECRRYLAERIEAIEYDDSMAGYLDKNEMPALIAYIEELEGQVAEAE